MVPIAGLTALAQIIATIVELSGKASSATGERLKVIIGAIVTIGAHAQRVSEMLTVAAAEGRDSLTEAEKDVLRQGDDILRKEQEAVIAALP